MGRRSWLVSPLLALPAHALRGVLEDDAPPQQVVADPIGGRKVLLGARLRPAGDERLDLRIEGGALARADPEDRLEGAHHLACRLQVLPAECSRVAAAPRLAAETHPAPPPTPPPPPPPP